MMFICIYADNRDPFADDHLSHVGRREKALEKEEGSSKYQKKKSISYCWHPKGNQNKRKRLSLQGYIFFSAYYIVWLKDRSAYRMKKGNE